MFKKIVGISLLAIMPVATVQAKSSSSQLQVWVKNKGMQTIYFDIKTRISGKKNVKVLAGKSKTYVWPNPFDKMKKLTFTQGKKGGKALKLPFRSHYSVTDEYVKGYNQSQFGAEDEIKLYWKDAKVYKKAAKI